MSKFVLPQDSQLLFYPMKQCTISAGFKAKEYLKYYGYNHYGVDFDSLGDTDFDVLAGATGEVLGVEMNNGSAGGIVVVKYINIFVPSKKKTMDLIARYAHMISLYVKKGDRVVAYQPIGKVSGHHKWYNHIHMEIDTDTKYPFYTVGFKEAASRLLIASGATDRTLLNPLDVLVVGNEQTAILHPLATLVGTNDKPKYYEKEFKKELPNGSSNSSYQMLIQPINNMKITSGYRNTKYRETFRCTHFGQDAISIKGDRTVYASGDGKVIACGMDSICGNVVAIKYEKCINENTGETQDVIIRYFHLASIAVKAGQSVTKDTKIGVMGNTGILSTGVHLHYEIDTDAREQYACYTPTISRNGTVLKAGTASTVNPADFIHTKVSPPDYQSVQIVTDGYATSEDKDMKVIK